ncbi:MAG TPA: hypothetical protein V6C72_02100, partial [Chroococcales cyanobacterium]
PNTPADILERLAHDDSPDVRYVMAENANTGSETLEKLLQDENCYVSHRARQTLNRLNPPQLATHPGWGTRPEAAKERRAAIG